MRITIREIEHRDDESLAFLIRATLSEFGAAKPGTVFFDPTTDHLSDVFTEAGSHYFVVEIDDKVAGGAGIFPTENLPEGTCELVKLYLLPEARGQGIGKKLMAACEEKASELGYDQVYLETMPELNIAVPLYEKMGYRKLEHPMGNSGHTGCGIWMLKKL